MTKTCTSTLNEVVRYIFNETTVSENEFIEKAITSDEAVLDFYLDCIEIIEDMNQIELCPSQKSINRILSFSQNYKPAIIS